MNKWINVCVCVMRNDIMRDWKKKEWLKALPQIKLDILKENSSTNVDNILMNQNKDIISTFPHTFH